MSKTVETMEKCLLKVQANLSKTNVYKTIFKDGNIVTVSLVDNLRLAWQFQFFAANSDGDVSFQAICKAPGNCFFRKPKIMSENLALKKINLEYDSVRDSWKVKVLTNKGALHDTKMFWEINKPQSKFVDSFKLTFEVEIWKSKESSKVISEPDISLNDHLMSLLVKGRHSDLTLHAEGKQFKVHRCIIAELCPKLESLIYNKNAKPVIKFRHLSAVLLEEIVSFIYTGKILRLENLPDIATLAEKLQFQLLVDHCKKLALLQIKKETVLPILILADLFKATDILSTGLDFIKRNPSILPELFTSLNWMKILAYHKALSVEVAKTAGCSEQFDCPPAYEDTLNTLCSSLQLSDETPTPTPSNIYPSLTLDMNS